MVVRMLGVVVIVVEVKFMMLRVMLMLWRSKEEVRVFTVKETTDR